MESLNHWWSGLEFLMKDYILNTADRINFYKVNGYLVNDKWPELKESPDSTAEILIKDNFLHLRGSEKSYSIAYPVFAISKHITKSKFNIPFVRLIDEHGFTDCEGTMVFDRAMQAHFKGCVSFIQELSKTDAISKIELTLFTNRLLHYAKYNPEQFKKLSKIMKELSLPENDYSIFYDAAGGATTNAKAIKNTITYIESNELTIIQKVDLLLGLRRLLGALEGSKINRLIPFLKRLDPLFYNHPHPMVRDLYLVCINQIVRLCFYHNLKGKEVECLDYLKKLVEQKINLDINLAQKSILEYHLSDSNSENTWNELLQVAKQTKYKLPLINSWYDELDINEWRKHALNHIIDITK